MGELEHLKEWEVVGWIVISTTSSMKNSALTNTGQNPDLCDEQQATNRLSYDMSYS